MERTRTSITNSLKKKLADLMQDFTALRNNIVNQYRDVVDRRYYTVTGEKPTEGQIDQLIETGEAENLFQQAILKQGRGRVRS
jgi:syntaxin 1B/2/3